MPYFELLIGALVVALPAYLSYEHGPELCAFLGKDGSAVYNVQYLSALAALLGFAIAAIAIVATLVSGKGFRSLRDSDTYENFWLAFKWSIRAPAMATLIALVSMFSNEVALLQKPTFLVVLFVLTASASSLARSGCAPELVLSKTKSISATPVRMVTSYPEVVP